MFQWINCNVRKEQVIRMTSKKIWLIIVMMLILVSSVNAENIILKSDGYQEEEIFSFSGFTFSTARSASSGTLGSDNVSQAISYENGGDYYLWRSFVPINSSPIPDLSKINEAELCIYVTYNGTDGDVYDYVSVVGETSQDDFKNLVGGDFDQCGDLNGVSEAGERINTTDFNTGYSCFNFSSTGISWVNKFSLTKLGIREGHDIDNNAPTTTYNGIYFYNDKALSGYEPYLNVSYTPAPINSSGIVITFKDELTSSIVDDRTITLDIIGDNYSSSNSVTNGYFSGILSPDTYTLRYSANDYSERFYTLTVSFNTTHELDLYLLDDSVVFNVTVTVVDQNSEGVEGALVKSLKYDIGSNSYVLREVGSTNFLGETILSMTYNDEFYKFQVEYEEETLTTTNPLYIQSNTYTIQIITGEGVGQDFEHYGSLDYTLTYNNDTGNFRLDYNDISGLIDEVCLYIYNTTLFDKVLINSTCLSTASGTILTGITPTNNTSYEAKAYYTKDSKTSYLTGYSVSFTTDPEFLNFGLLLQIIITTTFALMALWKIEVSAIITPLSLILGRMIGLTTFDYVILVPLMVVGIILAMIAGNRK
jgi:hypothetical protein